MSSEMSHGAKVIQPFGIWLIILMAISSVNGNACSDVQHEHKTSTGNICFFIPSARVTWSKAVQSCELEGSKLAMLGDQVPMETAATLMASSKENDIWIGAMKQQIGEIAWENGEKLLNQIESYPWANANSFLVDRGVGDDCVYIDSIKQWKNDLCPQGKGFICQFDEGSSGCFGDNQNVIIHGTSCYFIQYKEYSWFDARQSCQEMGAHMLRAENITQFNDLMTIIAKTPAYVQQDIWIGLTRNKWIWVTGEEVVKTFWGVDQPTSIGLCGALHAYTETEYKWKTSSCVTQMRYICQKNTLDQDPAVSAAPTGNNDRSGLHGGLLFLLILLGLVLLGIVIFMACFIRRGRAMKKQARRHAVEYKAHQAQRQPRRDVPDLDMFSCGNIGGQPIRAALNAGNRGSLPSLPSGGMNSNRRESAHLRPDEKKLLYNNNSKLDLQSKTSKSKCISKYDSQHKEFDDDVYEDIKNSMPPSLAGGGEDQYEVPFKSIQNAKARSCKEEPYYEEPAKTRAKNKRDLLPYQSAELFTISNSSGNPVPNIRTEESMVMQSVNADENDDGTDGNHSYDETDRSKYIEDVAKAFDFLVLKDSHALDDGSDHPKISGRKDKERRIAKRDHRRGSLQSDSGVASENQDGDTPKKVEEIKTSPNGAQLVGGPGRHSMRERVKEKSERDNLKQRLRSRSSSFREMKSPDEFGVTVRKPHHKTNREESLHHKSSTDVGLVNSAFTDGDLEKEGREKRHRHRREQSEEELAERRRRKREKGKLKSDRKDSHEIIEIPDQMDEGLTRVGSPMPALGQLPPLIPQSREKKKKHRDNREHRDKQHRKHSNMTAAEKEEMKRRHKRKRERERKKRERTLKANQPEVKAIQVQGDRYEEQEYGSPISATSSGEESDVRVSPLPEDSFPPGAKSHLKGRNPSDSGGQNVYTIDGFGSGEGIDV